MAANGELPRLTHLRFAGNNFLVHETFHVTINANGSVTAFLDNFSIDCR